MFHWLGKHCVRGSFWGLPRGFCSARPRFRCAGVWRHQNGCMNGRLHKQTNERTKRLFRTHSGLEAFINPSFPVCWELLLKWETFQRIKLDIISVRFEADRAAELEVTPHPAILPVRDFGCVCAAFAFEDFLYFFMESTIFHIGDD